MSSKYFIYFYIYLYLKDKQKRSQIGLFGTVGMMAVKWERERVNDGSELKKTTTLQCCLLCGSQVTVAVMIKASRNRQQ